MKALLEAPCGGVPATYLSSQQGARERRAVLAELAAAAPTCKLLYVTPEQLVKSGALVDALTRLRARGRLARLVVDEARAPTPAVACLCELQCAACTVVRAGQQHCMPCWGCASDCVLCGGDFSNMLGFRTVSGLQAYVLILLKTLFSAAHPVLQYAWTMMPSDLSTCVF